MITDSIFNEANMFLQAAQDGDLKKVNTLLSDGKVDLDVANQVNRLCNYDIRLSTVLTIAIFL